MMTSRQADFTLCSQTKARCYWMFVKGFVFVQCELDLEAPLPEITPPIVGTELQ